MGKKRRNSILRRPDSAATEAATDAVGTSNEKQKAARTKVSIESEKENQASGSGTDSDASGPVTRKNARSRRVSFGAHIACKDMDTGRITNLKIPHPSFTSEASLAIGNVSLGSASLTSVIVPPQIQEMEMSLDDSMGMNKTTVGHESSDSLGLSETSGDAMEVSLLSGTSGVKPTLASGNSLLPALGNGATRKSHLPFAFSSGNDGALDETNDSLISTTSAICPPGLTGKLNFQAIKKSSADDELDALDDEKGCDAGFLASMRRVSRGKVVANRKTALDSHTISNIVDVINGDDGTDNSLDLDDDMDMEDSVRGIFEMIDGVEPTKPFEVDIPGLEASTDEVMQMTLGKTLIGSTGLTKLSALTPTANGMSLTSVENFTTQNVPSMSKKPTPNVTSMTSVMSMTSKEMSMTISNESSLSLKGESTTCPMSVIQPPEVIEKPVASKSVCNEDLSLSGNSTLIDQSAYLEAMEMTVAQTRHNALSKMNETSATRSDMDFTRVNKTTAPKQRPSSSGMKDDTLEVSQSDKTLFKPPALPSSAILDESVDISLSSETSFRRSNRLRSKPSVSEDSAVKRITSTAKLDSSVVSSKTPADESVNISIASDVDVSINRSTRSKKGSNKENSLVSSVLEQSDSTSDRSAKKLDSKATDESLETQKSGKSGARARKAKTKRDSLLNHSGSRVEVKEVVQSMAEVSLQEEPDVGPEMELKMPISGSSAGLKLPEKVTSVSVPASTTLERSSSEFPPSRSTSPPNDSRQFLEPSPSSSVPPETSPSPSVPPKTDQLPSTPPGAFWLNPQPSSGPFQPSPHKKNMSAGIIDEEMPMMTFEVGGTHDDALDHPLETSVAVIKDLSSLAALSFADPKESLIDLLSQCCIDIEAMDNKWNDVVVPLFERGSSPETTITVPTDDGEESFKESLLRGHLGEARHLSITLAFNDFKDNYFVKVARLNCLIDKIQKESGETPGFLHEWLDGDEEAKRSVERRVKRMFKLYESKDYKNKSNYLTRFDQTFLEHIEAEKSTVRKQLQDLRSINSTVESLLDDAHEIVKSQEEEIVKRRNAEKESESSLTDLKTKLQQLETTRRDEEDAWKRKKESDAELKKLAKEKEEEWKEKEGRRKLVIATKDRIAVVKKRLSHYDSRDSHPWKLENFHLGAGGFFFFRFPRWKFTYDVSLGAATPFTASPSPSGGATFEVASTTLVCGALKRGAAIALDGYECSSKDLDTRLPVLLHQMTYGEESQRMWTFADLKSRLTDIVELLDSCRKLFDLYDQIGSLKVDKRRKDWFQMPGLAVEDNKLFLTIHVRRGIGGNWPLALVLKFLLTPSTETHAAGFNQPPFDDRMLISDWTEFSSYNVDLAEFRTAVLSNVNIEDTFQTAAAESSFPQFHRFILNVLNETEKLLDDDYARLYGDRSEMSLDIPG